MEIWQILIQHLVGGGGRNLDSSLFFPKKVDLSKR